MSIGQLIYLEWSKWSRNSVFKAMSLTYFILAPLLIFMAKSINDVPPLPSPQMVFKFPDVWNFLGYSGSWLAFFCLGFFAVYMITAEFGWRTMRQSIINGQTRREFFMGKVYFILLYAGAVSLYYLVSGAAIGYYHSDAVGLTDLFDNDYAVVRYFLMVLGYMTFGLMVGFLVRRSGLALFTYFGYILFAESLFRWAVHYKIFEGNSHYYYPMNVIEDLMGNPLLKMADDFSVSSGGKSSVLYLLSSGESIAFASIYVLIFIAAAWFLFRRRDI